MRVLRGKTVPRGMPRRLFARRLHHGCCGGRPGRLAEGGRADPRQQSAGRRVWRGLPRQPLRSRLLPPHVRPPGRDPIGSGVYHPAGKGDVRPARFRPPARKRAKSGDHRGRSFRMSDHGVLWRFRIVGSAGQDGSGSRKKNEKSDWRQPADDPPLGGSFSVLHDRRSLHMD